MKWKDFKTTVYLLIIWAKLRFIVYKGIGVKVLKKYHLMAIVLPSLRLHCKLMIFTFIFIYLKDQINEFFVYLITVAWCFLIVLGKLIHATYLKERKEIEMTLFRHVEEESKNTPLNGGATKH